MLILTVALQHPRGEATWTPHSLVGLIILAGFIFGEIAWKIKLPKVTGYIKRKGPRVHHPHR